MTARSLDEARELALDELGVDADDAEFEILEEPRQGLFGRQRGEARVRARVRPTVPRPKVERRRRRGTRSEDTPQSGLPKVESRTDGDPDGVPAPTRARPKGRRGGSSKPPRSDEAPSETDGTDQPPAMGIAGGSPETGESGIRTNPARRRRGSGGSGSGGSGSGGSGSGGSRGEGGPTGRTGPPGDNDKDHDERNAMEGEEQLTMAQQGQAAGDFVLGLVERFGVAGDLVVVELDDDTVEVQVTGADLGLLVGPKGATLAAIQELSRTVVQRRSVSRSGRIMVDIAGYRQRRRAALEQFTMQVAATVVSSGVQKVLEPMSAADRKVVHDTANSIAGVRTVSEGEEPRRRVVLVPDGTGDGPPSAGSEVLLDS